MSTVFNKRFVTEAIIVILIAVVSSVVQWFAGNIPADIFAFPLNIVCIALWLTLVVVLYRNRQTIALAQSLLSMRATWLSLAIMVVVGIYLGLQREPNSGAWPVVVGILFVLTHLAFITLRGWRNGGGIRWRFTLLHAGLFITLAAGFWGAPDREQLRTPLFEAEPTNIAYHTNGTASALDYRLELKDLKAEYDKSGMPTHFEAEILIDNKSVTLTVNHPYNRTLGEKLYLVSVVNNHNNNQPYCIVEIVREPWQWVSLAGIVMLIAGAVMLFVRGPRHAATKR